MKLLRNVMLASVLGVSAFSAITFTSCKKEDSTCNVGYTGSSCKDAVRTTYYNTYKGSGFDNTQTSYPNYSLTFKQLSDDVTKMQMILNDATTAPVFAVNVTLTTNTTFTIDQTVYQGETLTGNGTINATTASLTLTGVDNGTTTVYTFQNMIKQ
jgi:hypothetical protein